MCIDSVFSPAFDDFIDTSGTFNINNSTSTQLQCISITIVNDTVSESSKECFLVILAASTETFDDHKVTTVCITDNDGQSLFLVFSSYHSLLFLMHVAYSVTIGLQQTAYTVSEADQHQLVCLKVLSGDVDGREFVINYATSSGTASKLPLCKHA